ncbi:PH domain-containing protein [Microbacteriaceae bacterium VKM Ac-2855]|nr:PH domain-containing protein [Microbacteriaceae bacterium VKM Ac-2855]
MAAAERDVARLRPHARAAAGPVAGFLVIVLLSFYFCAQFDSAFQRGVIVLGSAVLVLLACAPGFAGWASIRYRITTDRLLARRGVLRKRRGELVFVSDLEVTVTRTVGQRIARSGNVRIARAGAPVFVLRDLPDAELVAEVLRERIAAAPAPEWPPPVA